MTRVTILSDNEVVDSRPKGLRAEWGFAADVDGLLFDTGQTGIAADNADKLGLGPYETIVLSHGHYDHTKGLPAFVDDVEEIYVHPDAFEPKYHGEESIGLPYTREWIASYATINTHRDPVEVADGIYALGEIPRRYPDSSTGELRDSDGNARPDPVHDDQSLAVEGEDGLGLVLGCCHAGLRNTVAHAEDVFDRPVRTVLGGTHLRSPDPDELDEIVAWVTDRVDRIAPTHCTGHDARRKLEDAFGEDYERVGVGSTIEL
ncbi:MBL fold metallo-hydrolase [Halapricum desulfuricans]|uniref:Metal-dependent hydrolase of the beta-lactamase superfamily II n=1 Tax=Halapricum desulfuricans TaxID=2841257 RepID=A0A897NBF8_9EURY|nr:MBL fold metallo-hydrolase [Halapricum desulfuricans]QSG08735.1 Metal-dependent hydrolase of the beta-lactamase superfamily II [Halapricum desulfuricans]